MRTVSHLVRRHVKAEGAPWRCSLCGFQAISREALGKHVKLEQHIQEKKRRPDEWCEFIMSANPYTVKIGVDYMIVTDENPKYVEMKNCLENRKRPAPAPDVSTKRIQIGNSPMILLTKDNQDGSKKPKLIEQKNPQLLTSETLRNIDHLDGQNHVSGKSKRIRGWLTGNCITENGDPRGKSSMAGGDENRIVPNARCIEPATTPTPCANGGMSIPMKRTPEIESHSDIDDMTSVVKNKKDLHVTFSYKQDALRDAHSSKPILKNVQSTNSKILAQSSSDPELNTSLSGKTRLINKQITPPVKKQMSSRRYNQDPQQEQKPRLINKETQTPKQTTAEMFEMNGAMLMQAIGALTAALQPLRDIEKSMVKQDHHLKVVVPLLEAVTMVLETPRQMKNASEERCTSKKTPSSQ